MISQICHLDAVNHNESTILSMNLAILISCFDSPPQSCVVSVIWTCVNTNTVRFTDVQTFDFDSAGSKATQENVFTTLGLTELLES